MSNITKALSTRLSREERQLKSETPLDDTTRRVSIFIASTVSSLGDIGVRAARNGGNAAEMIVIGNSSNLLTTQLSRDASFALSHPVDRQRRR
jgi:hypothetical protein